LWENWTFDASVSLTQRDSFSSTQELEYGLFHLKDTKSAENPYKMTVNVNGETLTLEIDTVA